MNIILLLSFIFTSLSLIHFSSFLVFSLSYLFSWLFSMLLIKFHLIFYPGYLITNSLFLRYFVFSSFLRQFSFHISLVFVVVVVFPFSFLVFEFLTRFLISSNTYLIIYLILRVFFCFFLETSLCMCEIFSFVWKFVFWFLRIVLHEFANLHFVHFYCIGMFHKIPSLVMPFLFT